jgi:hypothetical protein
LSGARDDDDPARVRILPPAIAMQPNAIRGRVSSHGFGSFSWFFFSLLLLLSAMEWCPFFMAVFQQTGLKVLRMRLNFSETL